MSECLDPFRFLLISLAGWMNQRQLNAIEYLREEKSSETDAPGLGEGHTGFSPDSVGGHGARGCESRRRRTPSSVRAPSRIKVSSARFHPHWPVPLRGPIDRNRGRAREAPQEALSARRRGASGGQRLSLKDRVFRTTTPQDEISESVNRYATGVKSRIVLVDGRASLFHSPVTKSSRVRISPRRSQPDLAPIRNLAMDHELANSRRSHPSRGARIKMVA